VNNNVISAKVSNGGLAGALAGVVSSLLVTFIPAFHGGLPAIVQTLIPVGIGTAGYLIGGYLSKHQATAAEVQAAVNDAKQILALGNVTFGGVSFAGSGGVGGAGGSGSGGSAVATGFAGTVLGTGGAGAVTGR
jgi:hypothetical protein